MTTDAEAVTDVDTGKPVAFAEGGQLSDPGDPSPGVVSLSPDLDAGADLAVNEPVSDGGEPSLLLAEGGLTYGE